MTWVGLAGVYRAVRLLRWDIENEWGNESLVSGLSGVELTRFGKREMSVWRVNQAWIRLIWSSFLVFFY